ncbi:MAG: hypothetical protein IT162_02585 [Bryobacterales bacterium]|nr:hypothetical protein [Bryobacterales bacterium]
MMHDLGPILVMIFVFALVLLLLRHLQARALHRERLVAIEKGVDIKPIMLNAMPAFSHRLYLLRGLMWLCGGAGLMVALMFVAPLMADHDHEPQWNLEQKLHRERHLTSLGATPAQIEAMEKEIDRNRRSRPDPRDARMIGLVPMFVGVAYLIFFGVEEFRVRRQPPA